MPSFRQLLVVVVVSCAMMINLNAQVMTGPPSTQSSYSSTTPPARTITQSSMGAQQVLSQPLPQAAAATKTYPQAGVPLSNNTAYSQASKPTSTLELPPPQSSYSLNNSNSGIGKNQSSTMVETTTMAMAPKTNAAVNFGTSTSPPQVNSQVKNIPPPSNQSTSPARDTPRPGKNPAPPTPLDANAIISDIEAQQSMNHSAVTTNSTPTSSLGLVRNPIIPTNQTVVANANGTSTYQPVNKGNLSSGQRTNMTPTGTTMTNITGATELSAMNNNYSTGKIAPSDQVVVVSGMMDPSLPPSEMGRVNNNNNTTYDAVSQQISQQVATERFNSKMEKNPKDDLLVQQLLDQFMAASKMKLTSHQISNQTAFLNSLDAEQRIILESKLKSLQLTATQQQLERNYLASFVSEKTKAAHQAGFDAIKKSLTPEAQKSFDPTEGMQSLDLTDEQKYQFEEGSREFLEDAGTRFDSSSHAIANTFSTYRNTLFSLVFLLSINHVLLL